MTAAAGKTGKLLLIDGYSLVHRAFFALPPLHNAEGRPTNAVFGFLNMLLKLLDEEQPDGLIVAFDAPGPTFRSELYTDYKAQRPETPDELKSQFDLVKQALAVLQIPVLEATGYEADDVIGTLAKQARAAGHEVLIVTGDRDLLQLVADGVTAMITRRGIRDLHRYDVSAVEQEYGVSPRQLIDVKALMGDTSDNIPGVPGVGEKTALKLIRQFGDLDTLLDRLDEVKGDKLAKTLAEHAEVARACRELATIATDAPVTFEWEQSLRRPPEEAEAREFFTWLGFGSILERLGIDRIDLNADASGQAGVDVTIVTDKAGLARLREELFGASHPLAVNYYLDGDERFPRLAYLALAADGKAWFVAPAAPDAEAAMPRETAGSNAAAQGLTEDDVLDLAAAVVDRFAAGQTPSVVIHHGKPLLNVLARRGDALPSGLIRDWPEATRRLPMPAPFSMEAADFDEGDAPAAIAPSAAATAPPAWFDTALAAYLLAPERSSYPLRDLYQQYLQQAVPEPDDLPSERKRRKQTPLLAHYPATQVADVAARQTLLLPDLAEALHAALVENGLAWLFRYVETPLTMVLAAMEQHGILVDRQALLEFGEALDAQIAVLTDEIHALAGMPFNINSTRQLGEILFEKLGLPVIKKTKTGYSTDADVLEQLIAAHPIVEKVLAYRSLTKLRGTYVDGLIEEIEADGRIRTTFQQTVASTGRLASIHPNLQNIPIRDEVGRQLRRAFKAADGCLLLAADYSQIELRVLAHLSQDPIMLEAFRQNDDIHRRTASEIFGVPQDQVTGEMRAIAKAVNFGLIYGQTDYGLAQQLRIPRADAKRFIERYFERYAGVRRYLEDVVAAARRNGYVTTLFGRRRYLPDITHRVFHRRAFAERTAKNSPIQGTAADIIKIAMIRVHRRLQAEHPASKLVLQVHDELIVETPEADVDAVATLVRTEMAGAATLSVPLVIDVNVGPDWYDMQAWERDHA